MDIIKFYGIIIFGIIIIGDAFLIIYQKEDKLKCLIEILIYFPILYYLINK